ncbi:MAG TPA: DUF11 domain-containing protein, partial [Thermoplasmatales archaeon]|nr:DUF11 domain-containing protein [Thermoplasmatales archaeon]
LNYAIPSASGSYPTYHWNLGTISAGDSEIITINVSVASDTSGIIYNNANVTSDTYDPYTPNNDAIEDTISYIPGMLLITKEDSQDPVSPDEIFYYEVRVENLGGTEIENAVIKEVYDENITFISSNPPPASYPDTWIVSLSPGENFTINITVRVNKPLDNGTILINYVNVTSPTSYSEAIETTEVVSSPELHISKESIPVYTEPGATILYRIRVSNNGTMRATNVTVEDVYDENITVISESPPSVNQTWIFDELDVGSFYEIEIQALVSGDIEEGSVIINYANVTCDQNSYDETEVYTYIRSSPPWTYKKFNGLVINHTLWQTDGMYILHYIPPSTTIDLVAVDNESGVNITMYRIFKWHDGWKLLFDWEKYGITFPYPPYYPINLSQLGILYNYTPCGKYQIEFYSIDNSGNVEKVRWNDVFVDCFTPISQIEKIIPYEIAGREVNITVNATDLGVGVEKVELYYRYSEDNTSWNGWILYGEKTNNFIWLFNGNYDGYYEFYSVAYDEIGNHEPLPNSTTPAKAKCKLFYPWDINYDERVNALDIYIIIQHWMQTPGDANWYERADVNKDSIIDGEDVMAVIAHWTG